MIDSPPVKGTLGRAQHGSYGANKIDAIKRHTPVDTRGLKIQLRRRVADRTNGSINYNHRLVRQHQTTAEAHQGFPGLSQIAPPLRRLDPGQIFDTLLGIRS